MPDIEVGIQATQFAAQEPTDPAVKIYSGKMSDIQIGRDNRALEGIAFLGGR